MKVNRVMFFVCFVLCCSYGYGQRQSAAERKAAIEQMLEMVVVEGNGKINSFSIGRYEVTQGLWKAVMGKNPSMFKDGDNYPVEMVSWRDAQKFISKLNRITGMNYRLPMAAEWGYAARGGIKSNGYKYSGSNSLDDVAWYGESSGGHPHPVGTKAPNELGIYDMNGNVSEYVQDLDGTYKDNRWNHGGGWNAVLSHSTNGIGGGGSSSFRANYIGFRVVLPSIP
jgi:formylglycine-generating enzyme required for sulfatase activity